MPRIDKITTPTKVGVVILVLTQMLFYDFKTADDRQFFHLHFGSVDYSKNEQYENEYV